MDDQPLPLSALLSQVLVAFTIEADNEFEREMAAPGPGQGLAASLFLWLDVVRHIPTDGITIDELAEATRVADARSLLSGPERRGYVILGQGRTRGDGSYGSARGIQGDWVVRPTPGGERAQGVWRPLIGATEHRWRKRFGGTVDGLERALEASTDPAPTSGLYAQLSAALRSYTRHYASERVVPLEHAANVLRVLRQDGAVPIADLPRRTGIDRRRTDSSVRRLTISGVIAVEPAPSGRGKVATLTLEGEAARQAGHRRHEDGAHLGRSLRRRCRRPTAWRATGPSRASQAGGSLAPDPACWRPRRPWVSHTNYLLADPRAALPHHPFVSQGGGQTAAEHPSSVCVGTESPRRKPSRLRKLRAEDRRF